MNKPEKIDFERFFDLSADMMCIANLQGYFEVVNSSFTRILGYLEEELVNQSFMELIHPDDVASTQKEMQKLQQGYFTFNFINRYRHKDGHYLTLSWSSRFDEVTEKLFAVAQDQTQRIEQDHRLKQVITGLKENAIFAVTDAQGVIKEVNDQFCQVSGYERKELIGKTHKIINSGTHSKAFFADLWNTIKSGKMWSGTIRNKTKQGEDYFVKSIIYPIFDNNENIIEFQAIRYDVTDVYREQKEKIKTLDILNETSAIAKVGGWELEVATGDLNWTDETFKILEVQKQESAKPLLPEGLELFVEEHQPIIEQAVSRAIEFGEPYALELKALTAKGNVKWVYTNGRANYENGKIVTLSGTIQDIDQEKLAALELDEERQKAIKNSRLASLGELAASVAHEINNPVGVISGTAELLQLTKNKADPDYIDKKTDTILKSCERIAHIVKSLKRYSVFKDSDRHKPCSILSIVNEAVVLTTPKSKASFVDVSVICVRDFDVDCNEIELEQVVVNLINNAIEALADVDDKRIDIQIMKGENEHLLTVRDTGNPIPRDVADKIFDPFFSTKKEQGGSGLGMSIVQGILTQHGATIELDPETETTCFIIRFKNSKENQA